MRTPERVINLNTGDAILAKCGNYFLEQSKDDCLKWIICTPAYRDFQLLKKKMKNDNEYIWYASYGSNISKDRFLCYIKGGKPNGSQKEYKGCTNKSLPIENEEIYIKSELYFAKKSGTWNGGGVGFIKVNFDENSETLGRMYLITKEQFVEVVKQETNFNGELNIDFEKAIQNGNLIFRENSWYGNLVYLGNQNDKPIFTFTNAKNLNNEINPPDKNYLKTIANGLKETYKIDENEIEDYLKSKSGIIGNKIENEIKEIFE